MPGTLPRYFFQSALCGNRFLKNVVFFLAKAYRIVWHATVFRTNRRSIAQTHQMSTEKSSIINQIKVVFGAISSITIFFLYKYTKIFHFNTFIQKVHLQLFTTK